MVDKAPRAWQRMLSGRRLDLLDPSPLDVEIEDIAHGLSRVARWNGQTEGDQLFSVADHSLLVERIFVTQNPRASAPDRLAALLHDAPEFVIGDLISPFKAMIGGDYKRLEARLLAAVHIRFGLSPEPAPALTRRIKKADMVAAYCEAVALAGFAADEAERIFGAPSEPALARLRPVGRAPDDAKAAFLRRFEALFAATSGDAAR